jgi:hypothetical protein
MPTEPANEAPSAQPDWLLLTKDRLPDWGPPYTETPANLYAPEAPFIAEPWNTVTASIFIVVALAWAWRLRGRYRAYPFLTACLPILLAGGIGGTLFHGTRRSPIYFLLDVVPISLLGIAGSLFIAFRLWRHRAWWVFLPGVAVFYLAINALFLRIVAPTGGTLRINLSYASLAIVILSPIAIVLWRTRFRYGGWVAAGAISFGIAWTFRLVDRDIGGALPMGSHWLWHLFGAICTALMIQFFYLVEGEKSASSPRPRQESPQ